MNSRWPNIAILIQCDNCQSLSMQLKGYERVDDDGKPTDVGARLKTYYACGECGREIENVYTSGS